MANPGHLTILMRGVDEWKRWRDEHPADRPDLSGADLSGLEHLAGVDLHGADLARAKSIRYGLGILYTVLNRALKART